MTTKVILIAALVAVVLARPDRPPAYGYSAPAPSAPAKYDFEYAVNDPPSGNDFGHQESRDGDFTEGSYFVRLPDGRLQKVSYNVQGDSGFVAEVTYEAAYGQQRTYAPPPPTYG